MRVIVDGARCAVEGVQAMTTKHHHHHRRFTASSFLWLGLSLVPSLPTVRGYKDPTFLSCNCLFHPLPLNCLSFSPKLSSEPLQRSSSAFDHIPIQLPLHPHSRIPNNLPPQCPKPSLSSLPLFVNSSLRDPKSNPSFPQSLSVSRFPNLSVP